MIFGKDQLSDISQRIDYMRIQLKDAEQFNNLDWLTYKNNRDIQRNIERLIENVANASIDISKILLAGIEVEMPNSYKEIILTLGQIKVLDDKTSLNISNYAALRNFLAHEYLDLKWDKVKFFINNAQNDFGIFISSIKKKIEEIKI